MSVCYIALLVKEITLPPLMQFGKKGEEDDLPVNSGLSVCVDWNHQFFCINVCLLLLGVYVLTWLFSIWYST